MKMIEITIAFLSEFYFYRMKNKFSVDTALISKYNVAVPRYTSYPTVPHWQKEIPTNEEWISHLTSSYNDKPALSIYIHLPFCESLCTYCGCNKRITKNHDVETPYINAILKEWDLYLDKLPPNPIITELHLGGGTPTFFSPESLKYLITNLLSNVTVAKGHSFSFEAHPSSTTNAHLTTLYDLGFRRLSIGVQDISPMILKAINRHQSTDQVRQVTQSAREIGYSSINYDIIYGLPFQKAMHVYETIKFIEQELPDRIAFYSYAHVPWKSAGQRAFTIENVPSADEKVEMYELGKNMLEEIGYKTIGMDHFCLPSEELFDSYNKGNMHRNFMGYTSLYTKCSIGLGASAISDSWDMYVQNEKKVEDYQNALKENQLPILKGHVLSEEETAMRQHILNLFCRDYTNWNMDESESDGLPDTVFDLMPLVMDGLINYNSEGIRVTQKGKHFIRNVCAAIDPIFQHSHSGKEVFSKAI